MIEGTISSDADESSSRSGSNAAISPAPFRFLYTTSSREQSEAEKEDQHHQQEWEEGEAMDSTWVLLDDTSEDRHGRSREAAEAAGASSSPGSFPSLSRARSIDCQSPVANQSSKGYARMLKNATLNLAKAAISNTPKAVGMAVALTQQGYSIGKECYGWISKKTSKSILEWQRAQLLQLLPVQDTWYQQLASAFYSTLPTLEIVSIEGVAPHAIQAMLESIRSESLREQGYFFLAINEEEDARRFIIDKYLPAKAEEGKSHQELSKVYNLADKACDALPFCRPSSDDGLYQMLVIDVIAYEHEEATSACDQSREEGEGSSSWWRRETEPPARKSLYRMCSGNRLLPRYLITFKNPPIYH